MLRGPSRGEDSSIEYGAVESPDPSSLDTISLSSRRVKELEERLVRLESTRPAPPSSDWRTVWIRDPAEAAAYGFVYAVVAALTGGWADRLFALGSSTDYAQYGAVRLIFEVALQAAYNAAVAQYLRQAVNAIPIDEISDNKVPAQNGGIVFAFVTFSRQPRWKAKVLALNAALARARIFG